MNIQIFGLRKSFDTKKAERWFKERRIKYQYIDLVSKGVSPGEYRSIRAAVGSFDALVALGAVIRGETYHFEVVSNDACRAIMEVQLDTGVPIANGILTCETDEQAEVRMQLKGTDCAQAAVEMANLQKALAQ